MANAPQILSGKRKATFDEIIKIVGTISSTFHPEKIILFGSYANGNPTPESDVDLLVIMDHKNSLEKSSEISLSLRHIFPIDIIVRSPKEIEDRIKQGDFFLQSILNQGKLLYERPC